MNKLSKIVEILNNDEDTVILKVKDNKKIDLLSIGCFNGTEDMIVVSKHTNLHDGLAFRLVYKDGTTFSFTDNTLITSNIKAMKRIILDTVIYDFGIPVEDLTYVDLLKQFSDIKCLEDDLNASYTFELAGFENDFMVLRKNGAFMDHISFNDAIDYLSGRYRILSIVHSNSNQTGCDIYTIKTEKKD